jgi:transcriptional regulator with XRE-family HTH domain
MTPGPATVWSNRTDDPESARARLRSLADAMSTHQLAEQCGTTFNELNSFLRPGIDPAVFMSASGDRQATVNLLWANKRAGWTGADMARAAGISRQRVSVLLRSAPTETIPAPVKPATRRRRRPAPKFRQISSLPDFERRLTDGLVAEYRSGKPGALSRLDNHLAHLVATYRTPLDHLAAHCGLDRGLFAAADAVDAA